MSDIKYYNSLGEYFKIKRQKIKIVDAVSHPKKEETNTKDDKTKTNTKDDKTKTNTNKKGK